MRVDMLAIAIKIAGVIAGSAVIYFANRTMRANFERMTHMRPERDILLNITPSIPWQYLLFIAVPTLYLWYIVGPWEHRVVLLYLCAVLILLVYVGYIILRSSKNKLNNKYLSLCLQKGASFIPAGLNSSPVIKDDQWNDGKHEGVWFVGKQGTVADALKQKNQKDKNPKEAAKGFVVAILLLGLAIGLAWIITR